MNFHAKELRKCRVSSLNYVYIVTAITYARQNIFDDFNAARILIRTLQKSELDQHSETIGFVVMPDHLHWMFSLKSHLSLSGLVKRVKGQSARQINLVRANSNKVWQSGFYDHCLRSDEDLLSNMRYIVANPLRAGLARSLRLYPHWDCIYL